MLPTDLRKAIDVAVEKGARAPVVLCINDIAGFTDFVLIVSGRSKRHVGAIASEIDSALRHAGRPAHGTDGFTTHAWDVLDYDDFMVHVFDHPTRLHYDLEGMWNEAPWVELGLPADVMDTSDLPTSYDTDRWSRSPALQSGDEENFPSWWYRAAPSAS